MRTIETQVFQFDELSDAAKEKAREWYRSGDSYPWAEENRDSLEKFCEVFPVKARDWSYDAWNCSISLRVTCDDETAELSGPRLLAYLQNNYAGVFSRAKRYRKGAAVGTGVKVRKSRVMREETSCPFTGYWIDESLLDPLRAFLKKPDGRNFADLLTDCLESWVKNCRDDCQYQQSDESVDETIRANEYEFTADGERF